MNKQPEPEKDALGRIPSPSSPSQSEASPTPQSEARMFDRILGLKEGVQQNQVFVLCAFTLALLAGSSYLADELKTLTDTLDRAFFILPGFLVKEKSSEGLVKRNAA